MLRIVAGNEQRETKGRGARSEVRSEGPKPRVRSEAQKGRFGPRSSEEKVRQAIRREGSLSDQKRKWLEPNEL